MEKKEDLIKRINEAAEFMSKATGETHEEALNRLCISPQCGFASHEHGNPVDFDDVSRINSVLSRSRDDTDDLELSLKGPR